jgi:chemotaxis protein histidine kinase CheA
MGGKESSLEEKMKMLELIFLDKLPARLEDIRVALDQFVAAPDNAEHLELIHRLLHTMAGSAGTFGFDEVGEIARGFDNKLKAVIAGAPFTGEELVDFDRGIKDYLANTYKEIEQKKAAGA